MHKFNSITAVEDHLRSLHPQKQIAVISDASWYYVEDPGQMIRNWEKLIYEGPAGQFTVN